MSKGVEEADYRAELQIVLKGLIEGWSTRGARAVFYKRKNKRIARETKFFINKLEHFTMWSIDS